MVIGMHRSGTSAYTRIFGLLGADLPKNLLPPSPTNKTGYWESRDLMEIHDQVLASSGSNWDDWRAFNPDWFDSPASGPFRQRILDVLRRDFASSPLFAIKDPRICRLWPLWRDVLAEFGAKPLIIMPVRNPLEVAASLKRRNGFNPAKSHLLWLRHVLDAESATRGIPRAITSYDSLVEDWQDVVGNITSQLGLRWPRRGAMVDVEIEQYLSTEFKHHNIAPERLAGKPEVVDWVKEAYAALTHMAEDAENPADMARLDRIRASFDKASAAFGVALAMNEAELAKREADVHQLSGEFATLRETTARREREQEGATTALANELAAERAAVHEREAAGAKVRAELESAQAALGELAREHDQLAAALDAAKAAAAQSSEQVAALGREAEALRAAAQDREAAAATLSAELEAAQAAVNDRARERDQLAAALEGKKAAAARAAEQLAATQADLRAREGEVGRLSRELEAARLYLRDSQAEVQRLAGECDAARVDAARAGAEHQSLTEALAAASAERDLARSEVLAARGTNAALAAALEQARQDAEWRGEHLNDLSRELRAAAAEAARARHLEAALAALQQDNDRRELLVIELSQKLEAESGEKARLAAERQQALAATAAHAVRIRELEGQLETESGEKKRLAAELARTSEQIRQVERNTAERAATREAAHAAALAESEAKAQAQIGALREQLVDAEAALAKGRAERNRAPWKRLLSPSQKRRLGRQLVRSGLFDAAWYVREYPETARNGRAPVEHYLEEGYLRGFRPNPLFDSRWYLQRYGDVRRAGINPLVHYLQNGYREGRNPSPNFQTDYYLEANPDVRDAGANPLAHYLRYGRHEGRLPMRPS
jgi:hypothetical protein